MCTEDIDRSVVVACNEEPVVLSKLEFLVGTVFFLYLSDDDLDIIGIVRLVIFKFQAVIAQVIFSMISYKVTKGVVFEFGDHLLL